MSYYCKCCCFRTEKHYNFKRHMNSVRHKKLADVSIPNKIQDLSNNNISEFIDKNTSSEENSSNTCIYCHKHYKHRSSLSRHVKNCKLKTNKTIHDYIDILNEHKSIIDKQSIEIEQTDVKYHSIMKKLESITKELNIQNINNGCIVKGNQINTTIQLLNYSETDYDFLTDKDYIKCISDCNHCVKTLIEKVHFNKNKPENMNIYVSSIKGKFVMVYRKNKWQLMNKKDQVDDLYDYNEVILDNWYRDYHEKYPHIINSFKRYLKNKNNDDDLIKRVKDDILLMLYNQRDVINTTSNPPIAIMDETMEKQHLQSGNEVPI